MEEVDRSIRQAMVTIVRDPQIALASRGVLELFVVQTVGPNGRITGSNLAGQPIPLHGEAEQVVDSPGDQNVETISAGDDKLRMFTFGVRGGAYQVGRPLQENERVLDDLKWRTVLVVVLVTAAAALLGWLTARTVTAPLKRLTRGRHGRRAVGAAGRRGAGLGPGRGRSARHGVQRDARHAGQLARGPATPRRGRRPRAPHAVDQRADEPGGAAPPSRPRSRDASARARGSRDRDRGARRVGGRGRRARQGSDRRDAGDQLRAR